MKRNQISETIQNINTKFVDEATSYTGETKVTHPAWMKWGAIAACLALAAVLGIGIFQSGMLGGREQIATLDNGNKIRFVKSEAVAGQLDIAYQIETRALTEQEMDAVFADLPVTAYALFNAENGQILGIDGNIYDMKLIVSAPGVNLRDAVIEGEESTSDVDGVFVNAGYFHRGNYVIYYATFHLGECAVYIEHVGARDDGETVRNEITSAIQDLIELNRIDLSVINK